MWLDAFRTAVDRHPQRLAVRSDTASCSYGDLWARCHEAARQFGSAPPRRVVVDVKPLDTLVEVIGSWLAGRAAAVLHRSFSAAAVQAIEEFLTRTAPLRQAGASTPAEQLILTTSGSTGGPKHVVLPVGAVDAATASMAHWYAQPDGSQMLVATSLARTAGLVSSALSGLAQGWTLHAFPEGTPPTALQRHMRRHGVTVMNASPSFYRLFFSYWDGQPFPSLRHLTCGGEIIPAALAQQLSAAFPNATRFEAFGSTECSGRFSSVQSDDPPAQQGAMGPPLPHWEWQIRPVPGIAAPAGELFVRGPSLCLGYLRADGGYEGREADGWMGTRDLVRADPDGCLMYQGRLDGLLKSGGQLVNPVEVERVLNAVPGVAEARCVPAPHAVLGTVLIADVAAQPGVSLDPSALRQACQKQLEGYKVPREFRLVKQLDTTPLGKTAHSSSAVAGMARSGPGWNT